MLIAEPRVRLAILGAVGALVAGGLIAFVINAPHRDERPAPPPASQGGLIIDPEGADVGRIDAARPLRCFVNGVAVGELSLKECAERNGVATEALDVGRDPSGELAAGEPKIIPLPPLPATPPASATQRAAAPKLDACWRYAENRWRQLPSETTLGGCAQALFAGRCETAGNASYGRWGQQTLRLAPGKVEISADNASFRTLVEQGPGCSIPSLSG